MKSALSSSYTVFKESYKPTLNEVKYDNFADLINKLFSKDDTHDDNPSKNNNDKYDHPISISELKTFSSIDDEEFKQINSVYKLISKEFERDKNAKSGNFTFVVHPPSPSTTSTSMFPLIALISSQNPGSLSLWIGGGENGGVVYTKDLPWMMENYLTTTSSTTLTDKTMKTLTDDNDKFFTTYQHITTLAQTCENLLPYECQLKFRSLVELSEVTYLPSKLPGSKYFEWWDDVDDFVSTSLGDLVKGGGGGGDDDKDKGDSDVKVKKLGSGSGDGLVKIQWLSKLVDKKRRENGIVAGFESTRLLEFGLNKRSLTRVYSAFVRSGCVICENTVWSHDKISDVDEKVNKNEVRRPERDERAPSERSE